MVSERTSGARIDGPPPGRRPQSFGLLVGIGLAFVISFQTCFAMFLGSFVFWLIGRFWPRPEQRMNSVFVQNQESICAGVVAGAALIGVAMMAIEALAEYMGVKLS